MGKHSHISLLVLTSILVCTLVHPALGEVLRGIGTSSQGGWDFSEEAPVHWLDGDIAVGYVVDPPLGWLVWGANGGKIVLLADSTFEDLTEAPADTSLYKYEEQGIAGATYVCRTGDGHYAKFRYVSPSFSMIEYAYQTDGTPSFLDPVPVEETTWGRIKSLFK